MLFLRRNLGLIAFGLAVFLGTLALYWGLMLTEKGKLRSQVHMHFSCFISSSIFLLAC